MEEATGLDVEVRYAGSAELAAQILEEGEGSPADVYVVSWGESRALGRAAVRIGPGAGLRRHPPVSRPLPGATPDRGLHGAVPALGDRDGSHGGRGCAAFAGGGGQLAGSGQVRHAGLGVALFVGEAIVLDAQRVHGTRVSTVLGELPTNGTSSARHGKVMLRPEQLSVLPATGAGLPATLRGTIFHGHDATVLLERGAHQLRARVRQMPTDAPGEEVRVQVTGTAQFFPNWTRSGAAVTGPRGHHELRVAVRLGRCY